MVGQPTSLFMEIVDTIFQSCQQIGIGCYINVGGLAQFFYIRHIGIPLFYGKRPIRAKGWKNFWRTPFLLNIFVKLKGIYSFIGSTQ